MFDFDGTLCATREAISHCLAATFDRHREPPPSASAIAAVIRDGIALSETFVQLRGDRFTSDDADAWMKSYREIYNGGEGQARTYLFAGVERVLRHLKDTGCSVAVVSNKGEASVHGALEHFGIAGYIDLVAGDRPGMAKKPDPASYREIIAPAFPGISPAETMVVGDTAADISYARNIGARCCWASYGYGDAETCLRLSPDLVVADIGELVELCPEPAAREPGA